MLTVRQLDLLSYLSSSDYGINLENLAALCDVSKKTIRNDINSINISLKEFAKITKLTNQGYILKVINTELYMRFLNQQEFVSRQYNQRSGVILAIIFYEHSYISMDEIAERLYISKTAVSTETKTNWRIRDRTLISNTKGIKANIPEDEIRVLLSNILRFNKEVARALNLEEDYQNYYFKIVELTREIFNRYNIRLDGDSFNQIVTYLFVTISRNNKGFEIEKNAYPFLKTINYVDEIQSIINTELSISLEEQDVRGIYSKFKTLYPNTQLEMNQALYSYREVYDKLKQLNSVLSQDLNVSLNTSEEFVLFLLDYLNSLIYRQESNNYYTNFYKRSLFKENLLITHIIANYFLDIFNLRIPEAEIAYLVPIIAANFHQNEMSINILLISDEPKALVYHWLETIKKLPFNRKLEGAQYSPSYLNGKLDVPVSTIVLSTSHEVVLKNPGVIKIEPIVKERTHEWVLKSVNERLDQISKEENSYNDIIESLKTNKSSYKGGLLEFLSKEKKINDYEDFKIVTNDEIAIHLEFSHEKSPSFIEIIQFENIVIDKNRKIRYLILSKYSLADKNVVDYYNVLKSLLNTDFIEKLM